MSPRYSENKNNILTSARRRSIKQKVLAYEIRIHPLDVRVVLSEQVSIDRAQFGHENLQTSQIQLATLIDVP